MDAAWVLLCTMLVFWEQAGFALWEAGSLRAGSLHSILLKNMCDAAIGAVAFFTIGYGLALGGTGQGPFAGHGNFGLSGVDSSGYHEVFFHWAFAATAATTVSGCMAERTKFAGYIVYSFMITAFIYAIPVHWVWADAGWLCAWAPSGLFGVGMIDFAGSGIVHMLGGVAGLVGSFIVGPRAGRFEPAVDQRIFEGHSIALSTLGVYCLWFGWFGFNAGCTFGVSHGSWRSASLVCVNTALAPATSVLACLVIEKWRKGFYDAGACMNAVVAGLVGITGPCGVVDPWAASVIGLVSGATYCASWRMHERLKLDDPVHAVAVHAWPGAWGCIASGLFASPAQLRALDYVAGPGLFYSGNGTQLAAQLVGMLAVLGWTVLTSAAVFGGLRHVGLLRVSCEDEERGVDAAEHGVRPQPARPSARTVEMNEVKADVVSKAA